MRIGLLADPHGNAIGMAAAIAALDALGAERLLIAGDLVGYYPQVNEVIALAREREAVCVLGNHDVFLLRRAPIDEARWKAYNLDFVDCTISADNRRWLAELALTRELTLGDRRFLLCHGSPWSVDEYVYPDRFDEARFSTLDTDIVVLGHTHIPMLARAGATLVVNPGSCGQPRDYQSTASCALIDTRDASVRHVRAAYDVAAMQRLVASHGFDDRLSTILARTHDESGS